MALYGIPISEDQCIGDSLPVINSSFQTLDTRTASLSAASASEGHIKAWATFDGTTSPCTVTAGTNVASITKSATGVYNVAFTTALADANYAVLFGMSHHGNVSNDNVYALTVRGDGSGSPGVPALKTTTQLGLLNFNLNTNDPVDSQNCYFAVIR